MQAHLDANIQLDTREHTAFGWFPLARVLQGRAGEEGQVHPVVAALAQSREELLAMLDGAGEL